MLKQDDTGDVERGHCIETFFECDAPPKKNKKLSLIPKPSCFSIYFNWNPPLLPLFESCISNEVFNFILPEVAWRLGPEPELFA